jgi:regulator of cell morphogenesis and NO signaling
MAVITQTVRNIAAENPAAIRVFEHYGIDYCCGGRILLTEACSARNLDIDEVLACLEAAADAPVAENDDWTKKPLSALVAHIVEKHHAYVNRELPRLRVLADKVVTRHGETQSELPILESRLAQLGEELTHHQAKEEAILFPHIVSLERVAANGSAKPRGCFATIADPVAMMTQEHDHAGALIAQIRELSHNFTPPANSCPTFYAFYDGLREFEHDLYQHIHLENNILFPRAIAMESSKE